MQDSAITPAVSRSTTNDLPPRARAIIEWVEGDLNRAPFRPGGYKTSLLEAATVRAQQEADHLREIRRLDDLAFSFLRGAEGNQVEAENILEDVIKLLFEGGALSIWRYRILLTKIREGL